MSITKFGVLALLVALPLQEAFAQAIASPPVMNPVNGHHYQIITTTVTWDQAHAAAALSNFNGVQGHLVTFDDLAEDQFVYFTLNAGALGNAWIGLYQDLTDPNYSEPLGGWKWVTGEPMTYSNWGTGEPNNGGASEHFAGYWPADKWNDYNANDQAVGRYVIEFDTPAGVSYCYGDGSAAICPCGNISSGDVGCANSSGSGARLTIQGTPSLGLNNLTLSAANLMPGQTAILFEGTNVLMNGNGVLFGEGLRCAGGTLQRLGYQIPDASGASTWSPAITGTPGWNAGDTRHFQVWYSDSVGSPCSVGFNTSNAIEIVFAP